MSVRAFSLSIDWTVKMTGRILLLFFRLMSVLEVSVFTHFVLEGCGYDAHRMDILPQEVAQLPSRRWVRVVHTVPRFILRTHIIRVPVLFHGMCCLITNDSETPIKENLYLLAMTLTQQHPHCIWWFSPWSSNKDFSMTIPKTLSCHVSFS